MSPAGVSAAQNIAIYNEDAGSVDWDTQQGWKVDFTAGGYRVLQPVQVRANRVMATVFKPVESGQGENWLVQALVTDGGPNSPDAPIYDLNVDRVLNAADLYDANVGGDGPQWHVPMMWQQADGIMSQATIGFLASGTDTLFINYLQPPVVSNEPCTENCSEGFFNGHIDVQTYSAYGSNGLPSDDRAKYRYTQHTHLYDKKVGRVYVDFFDLYAADTADLSLIGHVEIDSTGDPAPASGIGEEEDFIALVANADFSPGGTLQIGNKQWNVLDYQIQLHKALKNWDPGVADSVPLDQDGDPMVYRWGDIKKEGGTVKVSFNDRAILDGGLHPTQSECVITNAIGGDVAQRGGATYDPVTKVGRWRNGALTIQLVKKSYFTDNPVNPAIAMVDIQKPGNSLVATLTTDGGQVLNTFIDEDGDGNPDGGPYDTIGGLLARNLPEHLWESSLFWHFGDLSRLTSLGRPCWGDAKWAEAVALEQDNDPLTAALGLRGSDLTSQTLPAAIDALRSQGCENSGAACNAEFKIFQSILDLGDEYLQRPVDGEESEIRSDAPVIISGGSTGAGLVGDGGDGSITQGTSYQPGRMSWTDVVK
jgi:hypothetical protein